MSAALAHALTEALWLALLLSAPPLVAVLATGVVMSLVQTATRVEERSVSTVPKLVAALVALALAGPWIGAELVRFLRAVLAALPAVGRS